MKKMLLKFICSVLGHPSGDKKRGYGPKLVEYTDNHWESYSECPRCGTIIREFLYGTYPGSRRSMCKNIVDNIPEDYKATPNGQKIKTQP